MSRRHDSLIPLSHQHQHALALALIIRRRIGLVKDEDEWREQMAAKIGKIYSAELAGHFDLEETVLFPRMEQYLGPLELVAELRQEHQTLRALVRIVTEKAIPMSALDVRNNPNLPQVAQRTPPPSNSLDQFSQSIDLHVRKEERQLFAEFEKRMPAAEARKVGLEIEARLLIVCPNP